MPRCLRWGFLEKHHRSRHHKSPSPICYRELKLVGWSGEGGEGAAAGASAEFFFRRTFPSRTCPVSFSVTGFSECRNNLRRLKTFFWFSQKPAVRGSLLDVFFAETNKCPGRQSSYKFLFFLPPRRPPPPSPSFPSMIQGNRPRRLSSITGARR